MKNLRAAATAVLNLAVLNLVSFQVLSSTAVLNLVQLKKKNSTGTAIDLRKFSSRSGRLPNFDQVAESLDGRVL